MSDAVHDYLAERQDQFPGVSVEQVWLRRYPLHDLAAQLFGTVGPISQAELKQTRYRGVNQQSIVGQSGLEWYYDRYLRGQDGAERVQVDALGRFKGYLSERKPIAGHSLKLSLNLGLQKAGQQALSQAIANSPPAPAGAFVALNPVNGEVYAMGSSPTFDPNIFTKPLSRVGLPEAQQRLERLPAVQPGDPEFVPDRLDVQGHHGDRGAAERRLEPRLDLRRHRRLSERSRRHASQRRPRRLRRGQPHPGDPGLLGQLLLQPRAAAQRRPDQAPQGGCAAAVGAWFRHRSPDGDRPRR